MGSAHPTSFRLTHRAISPLGVQSPQTWGVVNRADHHADNIRYVVLPLIGVVVLFKDPDTSIRVLTREGSAANVLWVQIGGSWYAFSYDRNSRSVVLTRGSIQGDVLAHFSNATTIPEILEVLRRFAPLHK